MPAVTHTSTAPRLLGVFTQRPDIARRLEEQLRPGRDQAAGETWLSAESPAGFVMVSARGTSRVPATSARSADGSFAVVDGEFYWDEPVQNDTEAVLERYECGGIGALNTLSGLATLTLWDARRQRLLLMRDPDGMAPCFYAQRDGALYWSSDLQTLLPYGTDRTVDLDALELLLASGFIASPRTLVSGIRRLAAGEVMLVEDPATPRQVRGLRYSGQPKQRVSKEDRATEFGARLESSIRRRYDGRSAAVLLSGGVDSTLLLGLLSRGLGVCVPAYTFRYEDYEGWKNEGPEAKRAADHFGVPHFEVSVGPRDVAERLPSMVEQYGEPFTFGVHSFKLEPLAQAGIEVVFSGQGSGWYEFRRDALAMQYARLPSPARRLLRMAPGLLRRPLPDLATRLGRVVRERTLEERAYPEMIASPEVRAALVSARGAAGRRRNALELHGRSLAEYRGESMRDQILLAHQQLHSVDHSMFWNYRWSRAMT